MPARRCPACDRELVQRPDEDVYHFRNRKTCDRDCFAKQARDRGRQLVDRKGELERAEVEKRVEEVRAKIRAKMTAEGCKFTDDLR